MTYKMHYYYLFFIMLPIIAILVLTYQAATLEKVAPKLQCWDVCKQTCTTLNAGVLDLTCLSNCPCKCSANKFVPPIN